MAKYLKADTAATIKIGPFVDSTDGVTAETALTIAQADVRISKNGGNIASKAETTAATHDELGYYDCPLGTGDTDTEGTLSVFVSEAGALPVRHDFIVLPAKVYDSLVLGSDDLEVDVIKQLGVAVTPAYQAIVTVHQITDAQVYAISWLKNGVPVTIASPTLQVTTLAASPANLLDVANDGVLPAEVVGSSNVAFLSDDTEALTAGVGYRYVVTATIDAATRTFQGTLVLNGSETAITVDGVAQAIARRTNAQLSSDASVAGSGSFADIILDIPAILTDTAAIDTKTTSAATSLQFLETAAGTIEGKIDVLDTVADRIEVDTIAIEAKIDIVDNNVDDVENAVQGLDQKVTTIDTVVDRIEADTTSIETKLDATDLVADTILARIDEVQLRADTVGTGTTTTTTLNFSDGISIGSGDLVGSIIVWRDRVLPSRRITANGSGTEAVSVTFSPALPTAPGDGVSLVITGYSEVSA